jgi:hypothetical protein
MALKDSPCYPLSMFMLYVRGCVIGVVAVLLAVTSSCGGGGGNSSSPTAPTPSSMSSPTPTPTPTVSVATFRVSLDTNCSGKTSDVQVSVDGTYIGTLQPGEELSSTATLGEHTLSATDATGAWDPRTVDLQATGSWVWRLRCHDFLKATSNRVRAMARSATPRSSDWLASAQGHLEGMASQR